MSRSTTKPVIITVAITGAVPRKKDNPGVPVTPEQQVESTHEAFEAGARWFTFTCAIRTNRRVPIQSCMAECRKACASTAPA